MGIKRILKILFKINILFFLFTNMVFAAMPPSGQLNNSFSEAAGGNRSYFVTLPKNYTPLKKYKLVLVFAGTDTTGKEMKDWFGQGWSSSAHGLEKNMSDTIFIYPDQKWRWGVDKGWALGPNGGDFSGNHDIKFTEELLSLVKRNYSIDSTRIFVTGHSWGGDMAAVVGCSLGDQFKAIAPVAANSPYWFYDDNNNAVKCKGNPAVWTVFGLADDFFGSKSPNGLFGKEQNTFWLDNHKCKISSTKKLSIETTEYTQCQVAPVRLTLYQLGQYSGGGSLKGHYPPDYFLKDVSRWFASF
ncbi:alpha/beta hydrolase family esterase [Acinetobacter guillouiae]|uniref:alpha/beta hydrolase family esterase n=1 Tax=Acinetobacter TaxID=469 RepID=UPI001FBB5A68|nr:alpha/beta hydrolase-fold protein [Acinetobacter sp. NyZ410]UOH20132.1 alpha/beta hydrolase-fold protein [Acinetobacter sp. NyZ410]